MSERRYHPAHPFSLHLTVAPIAWGKGRWPDNDWIDGEMLWVGWEENRVVYRQVRQEADGSLLIEGDADAGHDRRWMEQVLGWTAMPPSFADPVIDRLSREMTGLRPFANGSLFDGVISSIVGQSISVAAAATTQRRLAQLVNVGIEVRGRHFFPAPRAEDLVRVSVSDIRTTGVTGRRAEAISAIAHRMLAGEFPDADELREDTTELRRRLRTLPLVGPWTAESAMLWGLGLPDIHPTGDVALLRAARQVYGRSAMTMKELDQLAEGWIPGRAWAARLLWTKLLGSAPIG